jgi:hypothetical protein
MGPRASCPGSTSWHQCWGASGSHNSGKVKGHLFLRQWNPFLYLIIFSWYPIQWQGYRFGHIWPAPRVLFHLTSGLLLGRPPLLSLFSHSPWDSSALAGAGFTISTKSLNSVTPGGLSVLPPPSGTSRSYDMDWWSECRVSKNGPFSSTKT